MEDEIENRPELSVVIPCFNSEKTISELHQRLIKALDSLQVSYEIIYVNDDSEDNTSSLLQGIALENKGTTAVDLMFNVGQFKALICGLELSRGCYVVTMDDDLQHPPEEIAKLYHAIKSSDELDAVIGKYLKKRHSLFRNMGSIFVRKLIKNSNIKNNIQMTSFRCFKRTAVDVLLMYGTMFPSLGALIQKSTRRISNVDVEHHERKQGKSNYNLIKLFRIAYDLLFHYTSVPLRFVGTIGISVSFISIIFLLFYVINYISGSIALPGWTVVVLLINVYSGLILLSITIIGEYLRRVLQEVKGHPKFVIRKISRQ
jgi:polyisoprenyl-phosphate glycosyltransferase